MLTLSDRCYYPGSAAVGSAGTAADTAAGVIAATVAAALDNNVHLQAMLLLLMLVQDCCSCANWLR